MYWKIHIDPKSCYCELVVKMMMYCRVRIMITRRCIRWYTLLKLYSVSQIVCKKVCVWEPEKTWTIWHAGVKQPLSINKPTDCNFSSLPRVQKKTYRKAADWLGLYYTTERSLVNYPALFGQSQLSLFYWNTLLDLVSFKANMADESLYFQVFQGVLPFFHVFLEIPGYFQVLEYNYYQNSGYFPISGRRGNPVHCHSGVFNWLSDYHGTGMSDG